MNSIWLAIASLGIFFLGFRFYSAFIAKRIFKLDPNYKTPAHTYEDGRDYVPTNKWIVLGHHFTSVAGAAPIVGPAIAIYWGWLPAILWVALGTVFAAGVHDFGTIVLSLRNKGHSIGTLADRLIGKRAKILFLFIILILVLMINAVFAWVISNLFISFPASVLSIFIQIPLAIWIGYYTYKRQGNIIIPSILVLIVMYGTAVLASYVPALQIDLVNMFGGEDHTVMMGLNGVSMAFLVWIIILMVYVYIASVLPVWKLLQPRDFINAQQLILGLIILYLGLFVMAPMVTAPMTNVEATDVSWFPLLFITIACGAVSGFHGLVGSGTTSKQIDKEPDARFVGYLGAIGEGALAIITILAIGTYFSGGDGFAATYSSFSAAGSSGLNTFIQGAGQLATGVGIPAHVARTIIAVIVVSFAATTLDSSVRLMRYIIAELGVTYKIKPLTRVHVATSIAVILSALLVLGPKGPKGLGSGGYLLWPLFGTANQLLAGISFMLITIWLKRKGRPIIYTVLPMVFLLVMTLWGMAEQVIFQWSGYGGGEANLLLFSFGAIILGFACWILVESASIILKTKPEVEG
ncbi:carbon starvation protein A [Membranicola marinus]|uniref:Carbon starvation protein A n=1 Tax=Membranihabitans marinus TaxID=1227546 RepID=A0A953LA34_9BACT|nr:carbon starvation protein A [Membranihabitans marinus]MBY5959490.1 carbon starvation protein A [Membranihabitans marinus]